MKYTSKPKRKEHIRIKRVCGGLVVASYIDGHLCRRAYDGMSKRQAIKAYRSFLSMTDSHAISKGESYV